MGVKIRRFVEIMVPKLYIIGNGFDLAHGLPTRYWDYHEFLKQKGEIWMMNMLEFYFGNVQGKPSNILWSDLERALGIYDVEQIYAFLREGHTLDEDHIMRSIGEVEAEVQYHFVEICEKFSQTFTEWCESIDLNGVTPLNIFGFNASDRFLTFNYSSTLENVYGVDAGQIVHIHGLAGRDDELIVGHCNPAKMPKNIKEDFYDHKANYRAIVDTVNRLEKKTQMIISRHLPFFDGLKDVDEVVVIGHSIADVDIPYFAKVKKCADANARWAFSYYDTKEIKHIDDVASQLGIAASDYSKFQI